MAASIRKGGIPPIPARGPPGFGRREIAELMWGSDHPNSESTLPQSRRGRSGSGCQRCGRGVRSRIRQSGAIAAAGHPVGGNQTIGRRAQWIELQPPPTLRWWNMATRIDKDEIEVELPQNVDHPWEWEGKV